MALRPHPASVFYSFIQWHKTLYYLYYIVSKAIALVSTE